MSSEDPLSKARRLRDEKLAASRAAAAAKSSDTSPTGGRAARPLASTRTSSTAQTAAERDKARKELRDRQAAARGSTSTVAKAGTSFSRPGLSSSKTPGRDKEKATPKSPAGAELLVGGYVSIRSRVALLQVDNDDHTWEVEYDGTNEEGTVHSNLMRPCTALQMERLKKKDDEKTTSSDTSDTSCMDDITMKDWLIKYSSKATNQQMVAYRVRAVLASAVPLFMIVAD